MLYYFHPESLEEAVPSPVTQSDREQERNKRKQIRELMRDRKSPLIICPDTLEIKKCKGK